MAALPPIALGKYSARLYRGRPQLFGREKLKELGFKVIGVGR
jgi:hypothetical protein